MSDNSDFQYIVNTADSEPTPRQSAPPKALSRTRRLVGALLLALTSVLAFITITPDQLREVVLSPFRAHSARAPSPLASSESLPPVPEIYRRLHPNALPRAVAQDLESGRYYYDNRFPGNLGLAIACWRRALTHYGKSAPEELQRLIASAEKERARQFSQDSSDVCILLKQGKNDQAVMFLERMRADFLDITAPQYVWTSVMLSRYRRKE